MAQSNVCVAQKSRQMELPHSRGRGSSPATLMPGKLNLSNNQDRIHLDRNDMRHEIQPRVFATVAGLTVALALGGCAEADFWTTDPVSWLRTSQAQPAPTMTSQAQPVPTTTSRAQSAPTQARAEVAPAATYPRTNSLLTPFPNFSLVSATSVSDVWVRSNGSINSVNSARSNASLDPVYSNEAVDSARSNGLIDWMRSNSLADLARSKGLLDWARANGPVDSAQSNGLVNSARSNVSTSSVGSTGSVNEPSYMKVQDMGIRDENGG